MVREISQGATKGRSSYDEFNRSNGNLFDRRIWMGKDFEPFFKANERRIHFQIHRLGISANWYDEFYSEGVIALWQAYKDFDATRGTNIGTFINFRIRYRLVDLLRKKLRDEEVMAEVINEKVIEIDTGNRHVRTGMPIVNMNGVDGAGNHNDAFWREVRRHLSEKQWKWVVYFIIADLSVKEIMELEGVTADAVKGWGKAVRSKLRKEEVRKRLEGLR